MSAGNAVILCCISIKAHVKPDVIDVSRYTPFLFLEWRHDFQFDWVHHLQILGWVPRPILVLYGEHCGRQGRRFNTAVAIALFVSSGTGTASGIPCDWLHHLLGYLEY